MYNLNKILTVPQIQATDTFTIENEPIKSIDLMERASNAFVSSIEKRNIAGKKIVVVCGVGNNGGDGLAVSRILKSKGIDVTPILVKFKDKLSYECETNFRRYKNIQILNANSSIPDFKEYDIIIDAIFGSGLTSPIRGFTNEIIESINNANKIVFSIDVPSGLHCDTISWSNCIIESNLTVSFQRPKLSFFFTENNKYIQEWEIVDIGLDENFIQKQNSYYFLLDSSISKILKKRQKHSHKGVYGHSLLIAGSYGKIGAAVLAAKACLRSGVGLLTMYIPKCGYEVMQTSVPEAMCQTDENNFVISELPQLTGYKSIGIGPGLGKDPLTVDALRELFKNIDQPIVIDADAINLIAENNDLLKILPKNAILTPHLKEFERLVGKFSDSLEQLTKQKQFSKQHQCIVLLKGANTRITDANGSVFYNTSGNPGMATGGSGDVLTGILTGLLAQNYSCIEAALIGVYFHGYAGDIAVKKIGQNALIASDIIENLYIGQV